MSQPTRHQRKSRKSSSQSLQGKENRGLFYLQLLVAALLVVRLLIPTETSAQGSTLWLVQLWLVAGLGGALIATRSNCFRFRVDRFDLLLLVIILGHLLSTLTVFTGGGDRRVAINMLWEWVALGITFYLVRRLFLSQQLKQKLILATATTAIVLAGFGVWQHFVIFPSSIRLYENICHEKSGIELQKELSKIGVPTDRAGRMNWENRLHSTEPRATFILANSFAGVLASLFVLLIIWGTSHWKKEPLFICAFVFAASLMGYCLVLTKSRTAWVGAMAGILLWGILRWGGKSLQSKKWLLRVGVVVCLVLAVFVIAGVSGGIDREVFSEAPKSLLYRLQYWQGSWGVIQEHPFFGVGAGNFRFHYLQHKLAESSEEIADPHNLFLDIWTSGGLLALVGLMGMLLSTAPILLKRTDASQKTSSKDSKENDSNEQGKSDSLFIGTVVGFVFLILLRWLLDVHFDTTLFVMLAGWIVFYSLLKRLATSSKIPQYYYLCGGVVMVVHLLGAGGIERPAMVQTLLLLLAVAVPLKEKLPEKESSTDNAIIPEFRSSVPVITFWVVLFICCMMTATLPVLKNQIAMNYVTTATEIQTKEKYLSVAATVDPFSTSSTFQLAQLSFSKWNRPIAQENHFQDAIKWLNVILEKEPRNSGIWHVQGEWYLLKYKKTGLLLEVQSAVNSFYRAVELHPTSVLFRKDLAEAMYRANKSKAASVQATEALRLDEINRKYHHTDKYLSSGEIQQLKLFQKQQNEKSF